MATVDLFLVGSLYRQTIVFVRYLTIVPHKDNKVSVATCVAVSVVVSEYRA